MRFPLNLLIGIFGLYLLSACRKDNRQQYHYLEQEYHVLEEYLYVEYDQQDTSILSSRASTVDKIIAGDYENDQFKLFGYNLSLDDERYDRWSCSACGASGTGWMNYAYNSDNDSIRYTHKSADYAAPVPQRRPFVQGWGVKVTQAPTLPNSGEIYKLSYTYEATATNTYTTSNITASVSYTEQLGTYGEEVKLRVDGKEATFDKFISRGRVSYSDAMVSRSNTVYWKNDSLHLTIIEVRPGAGSTTDMVRHTYTGRKK